MAQQSPKLWYGFVRQSEGLAAELQLSSSSVPWVLLAGQSGEGRVQGPGPSLSTGSQPKGEKGKECLSPPLADTPDQPPLGYFLSSLFFFQFGAGSQHSASFPGEGCSDSLNNSDNHSGLRSSLRIVQ